LRGTAAAGGCLSADATRGVGVAMSVKALSTT
jgi:hypothetical protein